jgi:hypothetical protein
MVKVTEPGIETYWDDPYFFPSIFKETVDHWSTDTTIVIAMDVLTRMSGGSIDGLTFCKTGAEVTGVGVITICRMLSDDPFEFWLTALTIYGVSLGDGVVGNV